MVSKKYNTLKTWLNNYFFYFLQVLIIGASFFVVNRGLTNTIDLSQQRFWMEQRSKIAKSINPNLAKNITLIGIDAKFFNKEQISIQGLHRGYYARLIEKLTNHNPQTVTFDVFFEDEFKFTEVQQQDKVLNRVFKYYDNQLAKSINNNTILAGIYNLYTQNFKSPGSIFQKNAGGVGHINSIRNQEDNFVLGIPLILKDTNNNKILTLSLQTYIQSNLKKQQEIFGNNVQINYNIKEKDNIRQIKLPRETLNIPKNKNKNTLYPYSFTPLYIQNNNQIKYYSLYDILNNNYNPKDLEGQNIYIGSTDETYEDTVNTLVGNISGVLVHINQHIGLQNQDYIYTLNQNQKILLITLILLLNIGIITYLKKQQALSNIFALFVLELIFLYLLSFFLSFASLIDSPLTYSIFLPIGTILTAILIQLVFNLVYTMIDNNILKNKINDLFKLYVGDNPQLAQKIRNGNQKTKLSKQKTISLFFSDIKGFTSISEKLNAKETTQLLNLYLEHMSEDIGYHNGFIDKYIGDAILAFWENKNSPNSAVSSAIANIKSLDIIKPKIQSITNNKIQKINIRIGLHYGQAIVGDIGSSKHKLNYTVIGDNVNIGARLEGINKFYKTNICASKKFIDQIDPTLDIIYRKLDRITVKGKNKTTSIYQIYPFYKQDLNQSDIQKYSKHINLFEKGLSLYFKGNFQVAIKYFKKSQNIIQDETCKIFILRCHHLIDNKPKNWDGIWKFDKK